MSWMDEEQEAEFDARRTKTDRELEQEQVEALRGAVRVTEKAMGSVEIAQLARIHFNHLVEAGFSTELAAKVMVSTFPYVVMKHRE